MAGSWRVFALTAAMLLVASGAGAVDLQAVARVDVLSALAVSEVTELDFGAVTDNSGVVTLGVPGSITSDPSSIHAGGSVKPGVYRITGSANQTVSVSFTGASGPGLTIGSFATDQGDLSSVSLGPEGAVALTVGADLSVNEVEAEPGLDQALLFTISVAYN